MKKSYSITLALFFISFFSNAQCLMVPVALQQRVNQSKLVVEGKVTAVNSFWNDVHSMIYTSNEIEIYKIFKGEITPEKIIVITEGGQVENEMIVTNPGVQFALGQVGLFCLAKNNFPFIENINPSSYNLYSSGQGFIKYDLTDLTATDPFSSYDDINLNLYKPVLEYVGKSNFIAIKSADFFIPNNNYKGPQAIPTITSFSPSTTYAGTKGANILTITGTNFGSSYVAGTSKIEFKNANDGGSSYIVTPDNHIQTWTSTTITTWVPTGACNGTVRVTNSTSEVGTSSATIIVNYNETNVISGSTYYQPDLVNDNSAGGYTFVYNTTFNSNTGAVGAFERALTTWRCNTFVNITKSGITSIANNASDGTNVVTFDGSSALPSGVLATTYGYYASCATGVWYLSEVDLKIKTDGTDGVSWNYGPGATTGSLYDLESVCLHELGHAHQLGHTALSPVSVMHWAISNASDHRTLTTTSEIDGGNDIMSRSTISNSCGPTKMTALTSGTCSLIAAPVANFSASATSICTGASINYTDLSTNTPTSWSWTFTGGTPSTSTVQNPTGIVYAAAGIYSVTLTATNSSGSNTVTKTNYITVATAPTVAQSTITAGGPTSFCGTAGVVLSVAGTGFTYQWLKNGVNISGQTNQNYTAKATATFACVVSNSCSSLTSNSIDVIKNTAPTSSITQAPCSGGAVLLTCTPTPSTGITFQWKKGSSTLAGATNSTYSATSNGTYKCTVTITATGCTKTSSGSSVTITCKSFDSDEFLTVNIFPNPSSDYFIITTNSFDSNAAIKIYDLTGKLLETHLLLSDEIKIGNELPTGMYFARIEINGELKEVIKLVKSR